MEKQFLKNTLILLIALMCNPDVFGQDILKKGKDIVDNSKLKYTHTNAEYGKVSLAENTALEGPVLKVETTVRPKFIYKASTSIPLKKQALQKGQKVLVSFIGKTVKSGLETGEARFLCLLSQTDSYKGNIEATISLSKEWKTYYIPYEVTQNVAKNDLRFVLQFGFQPQEALFGEIKIRVFDKKIALESLPKTKIKYVGMEADASWRKKADERIEMHRKGDFEIAFSKNGKPLKNKNVTVKLVNHAFSWGATINAADIIDDKNQLKYLKKGFNEAVFANDLKIKSWGREKNRARTLKALDMVYETGIRVKGHVLIWPGFQYQNPNVKKLENNPEELTKVINDHVIDITNKTKGKITHWDVVNEAYTNKDFQRITGSEHILYDGFKILKAFHPEVGRFTNEYGIISKGGIDFEKQQWYYEYIQRVDKYTGGLVDGIGIQCHIGSDLTPPEKVISILNYYGTLQKKISISEFTMEIKDAEIRKKYTSDFMTAIFSQPNVSEFLFWGFHESGNPKAVVYKQDWSLAPMGQAYFDLVHDKWTTNIEQKTSATGTLSGRGYYGTYEYTFKDGGKRKTGTFTLKKGGGKNLKISIE